MSEMNRGMNEFSAFSDALAEIVRQASRFTVLVNARRRLPATGIVYAPDLVLTADHVIEREDNITVSLPEGQRVDATVKGRDPSRDLALLQLATPAGAASAQPAEGQVLVGQIAIALGRTEADAIQASMGIVNAVGGPARTGRRGMLEQYLRSDTTPYPGFSGGPLVDARGRLLGMNTSGLAMGQLITIPVTLAWNAAATLAEHGRILRGYLGVRSQPAPLPAAQQQTLGRSQETGLLLASIEEGSPAAEAGLIVGDILVGLGGQVVSDHDDLQTILGSAAIGQRIEAQVLRGGQPQNLSVTIRERVG